MHGDEVIPLDLLRFIRKQRGERVECTRGLSQRPHLYPVTEQHDNDEQRKLPPEVEFVRNQLERGCPRSDKRDSDRERDKEHHSRLARFQFREAAREEGLAAPEIHDGTEHGRDPRDERKVGKRVAHDLRKHHAESRDGHRDHQHDPEQPTELSNVMRVVHARHTIPLEGIHQPIEGHSQLP